MGVTILGGRRVLGVKEATESSGSKVPLVTVTCTDASSGQQESWAGDALVMAVGIKAAQSIVRSSPWLSRQEDFRALQNLSTVDVLAVRL